MPEQEIMVIPPGADHGVCQSCGQDVTSFKVGTPDGHEDEVPVVVLLPCGCTWTVTDA